MKITVSPPPKPPEREFVVLLTETEANQLRALIGATNSTTQLRDVLDGSRAVQQVYANADAMRRFTHALYVALDQAGASER